MSFSLPTQGMGRSRALLKLWLIATCGCSIDQGNNLDASNCVASTVISRFPWTIKYLADRKPSQPAVLVGLVEYLMQTAFTTTVLGMLHVFPLKRNILQHAYPVDRRKQGTLRPSVSRQASARWNRSRGTPSLAIARRIHTASTNRGEQDSATQNRGCRCTPSNPTIPPSAAV